MLTDDQVKKSLRYSILDGTFSAAMIGFGESFFIAFAIFLKADNIQIGLLGSLPQAMGSLVQIFSDRLIHFFNSRKRVVTLSALLQSLMYVPIALVFFFGTYRVYHLIAFITLYWIFGMILSPAWNSWLGDLTNEEERGAYFGRRNKITGFSTFISFSVAGFILQKFTGNETYQFIGFSVIFLSALASRIISFVFLLEQYEPYYTKRPQDHFSFADFLRQARHTNFGLFVLYLSLMNFSVSIASPFFTAYMLRDLHMSYMTYTVIHATAIIVKLAAFPVWGRTADAFGSRRVLSLTGFLIPLVPFLWFFSGDPYYLFCVQVYSGFIWGGFEMSSFNFIFDTTTPQKRATCIAYHNMIHGMALIVGAMLGGVIIRYNTVFRSQYLLVFLISAVLRFSASSFFIPKIREVRDVEKIAYPRLLMKVVSTMPTIGLIYHLIPLKRHNK